MHELNKPTIYLSLMFAMANINICLASDYFSEPHAYIDEVHTLNNGIFRNIVFESIDNEYFLKQYTHDQYAEPSDSQIPAVLSMQEQLLFLPEIAICPNACDVNNVPEKYEVVLERIEGTPIKFRVVESKRKNTEASELIQQLQSSEFESFIESTRVDNNTVGLSIAVTQGQKLLWSQGFGFADLSKQMKATANTPFRLGSVSKTFLGVALMQSVEQGTISLDQDINTLLPYQVVHPSFPEQAIRVKHLATHSSGLSDSIVYPCSYFLTTEPQINFYQQLGLLTDSQCPDGFSRDTDRFIQQYSSSSVPDYQLSENFNDYQPGLTYDYSNVGAGLLGQLIGLASGESINHFIQKNIFDPLMMVNSGYSAADFNAYPYRSKNYLATDSGTNEHADYAYPTYADGSLYSSANDLARYLMALSNKGQLNGQQILTPESIETLFSPLITDDEGNRHGLFWEVDDALIYHSGGDPGVSTLIILNRETQIGIVVLANSTDIEEEESIVGTITGVLLTLTGSIEN